MKNYKINKSLRIVVKFRLIMIINCHMINNKTFDKIYILWKNPKNIKYEYKHARNAMNMSTMIIITNRNIVLHSKLVIYYFKLVSQFVSQMNIKILRNVPPKYLRKVADTKNSSKRHIDTNTGKIIEFPTRGSFEVYYKNILLYSKLLVGTFPDLSYLCLIIK